MSGGNEKKILDLGCGRTKCPGSIGLDSAPLPGVDVVHDLLAIPYPFADNLFDEVIISHVLEHFDFTHILLILNECHRLLKPGGKLTISVPHAFTIAGYAPQHRTYFTFEYFEQFQKDHSFHYYADYRTSWKVVRRWCSVNIFNDRSLPGLSQSKITLAIEGFVGKVLSRCLRSRFFNTVDYLIKFLPVWLVSIHWKLEKE